MNVIVIGGGASGLMAAYAAAKNGNAVTLIEKNEKLGKKLYITGKGRCNLTNDCPPDEFLQNVLGGKKFLTGVIYSFPPQRMMAFLEEEGLPLKVERGGRVFPASDHASDVTKTLERACARLGVKILLNTEVLHIEKGDNFRVTTSGGDLTAEAVIVATGGLSYPATGSTGDGYRFAKEAGHSITPCVPSLVGLELKQSLEAQGVTLKNIVLTAKRGEKVLSSRLGELLFTHYGVSGPLVLTLSAEIGRLPVREISLFIDFKPALEEKELDARLIRDLSERKNEQMKNVMRGLLPAALCLPVLRAARVAAEKQANSLKREERACIVTALKNFALPPILSLRGFDEAVITSGGVSLSEVDPKTMESKKRRGLYFCGEVLDVDAYTGGFNLQIAFATGFAAGNSIK